MNYDSCDESKGFSFFPGTKNCKISEDTYYDKSPEDKLISKKGKCALDYCAKEDFDTKGCNNICDIAFFYFLFFLNNHLLIIIKYNLFSLNF